MGLKYGFTLLELLVVIAILGILSSAILVAINPLQKIKQARDANRMSVLSQMQLAIKAYMLTGRPPINRNPGSGYCSDHVDFLQELVDSGELTKIPATINNVAYCYYDYGPGNNIGALLMTNLEAISPTTIGPNGSCRPFNTGNWCDSTVATTNYCLCNPY